MFKNAIIGFFLAIAWGFFFAFCCGLFIKK